MDNSSSFFNEHSLESCSHNDIICRGSASYNKKVIWTPVKGGKRDSSSSEEGNGTTNVTYSITKQKENGYSSSILKNKTSGKSMNSFTNCAIINYSPLQKDSQKGERLKGYDVKDIKKCDMTAKLIEVSFKNY